MPETATPATPVTPERIMQMAFAYSAPLMLEAAVRERVFDVLDSGPKTLEQVSHETGASIRGLRAVMNAFVALELLTKDQADRYALTPESSTFLVRGKPAYYGALLMHTVTQLLPNWMQMSDILRTGKPARAVNTQEEGAAFFEEFVEALFPVNYRVAQTLAAALKLADAPEPVKVLDIAAGSGVWGVALAQASKNVSVTAVDWPRVLPVTRRVAKRHGVSEQFSYVDGDINDVAFGHGYHVAILGHILHSEGEPNSRRLLQKVFDALAPGGTVAIAEMVANDRRTGPAFAMIFAVNMLVNSDEGSTYSFTEISGWLQDAGFTNPRLLSAPSPSPLILATKPR